MTEPKPSDRVIWCRFPLADGQTAELNGLLAQGYEVVSITPYLSEGGGAIFTVASGLYTFRMLVHLRMTGRAGILRCHTIKDFPRGNWLESMNALIQTENAHGMALKQVIPAQGILNPENGSRLGRGTYAFFLFFTGQA